MNLGSGCLEEGPPGRPPDRPPMGPPGWERREERPIPEHPLWRGLRTLGLDKNQRARWREIESRLRKEEIRKGADLEVTRIELQEILDKEPVDLKAVEDHLKKMEALMTGIHLASIEAGEAFKALLTSPQKEALKNFRPMGPRGEGLLPGQRRMPPPGEEEDEGPGGKPGSPRK